jgi:nicotinate phosphoribosyltransferase
MRGGKRLKPSPSLAEIRACAARNLASLPEPLRHLESGTAYPVEITETLRRLAEEVDRRIAHLGALDHDR